MENFVATGPGGTPIPGFVPLYRFLWALTVPLWLLRGAPMGTRTRVFSKEEYDRLVKMDTSPNVDTRRSGSASSWR